MTPPQRRAGQAGEYCGHQRRWCRRARRNGRNGYQNTSRKRGPFSGKAACSVALFDMAKKRPRLVVRRAFEAAITNETRVASSTRETLIRQWGPGGSMRPPTYATTRGAAPHASCCRTDQICPFWSFLVRFGPFQAETDGIRPNRAISGTFGRNMPVSDEFRRNLPESVKSSKAAPFLLRTSAGMPHIRRL